MLIGGVTRALQDLQVDPEHIKQVHDALENVATTLERSSLVQRPIDPVFGASQQADSLTFHHAQARRVIEDTILGVAVDLQRFAAGVQKAVALVDDADMTNAEQLLAKQRAVELLAAATSFSEGDRRNHESRNHNLAGDS